MEPTTLSLAWKLVSEVTAGVGINELHRQLTNILRRQDAATLSVQQELHASLLDAVGSLSHSLNSEEHPYFRAIRSDKERRDEQERISLLFETIRSSFPKTGSILQPIDLFLDEDDEKPNVEQLLENLGVSEAVRSLPEVLRYAFMANLPLATIVHFRQRLAAKPGLFALLQTDLTLRSYKNLQHELDAVMKFLRKRLGRETPSASHSWWENLAHEFQRQISHELALLRRNLDGISESVGQVSLSVHVLDSKVDQLETTFKQEFQQLLEENTAARTRLLDRHKKVVGVRPALSVAFLDRESEVNNLRRYIGPEDKRTKIIVITGRAGIGKTALTSQIINEIEANSFHLDNRAPSISGIICLSARRNNTSLHELYAYLLELLKEDERKRIREFWRSSRVTNEQKAKFLIGLIGDQRYLVLIDNFEDSLTPDGLPKDEALNTFLSECLASQHHLKVLITSRDPILFPNGRTRLREIKLNKGLGREDSVQFLRKLDDDGQAQLRDSSEETVKEIVVRTFGIPRALEYVYALLLEGSIDGTLTPEDLLNHEEIWQAEVIDALQRENFRRLQDVAARRILEVLAVFDQPVPAVAVQFVIKDDWPTLNVPASIRRLTRRTFSKFDRPSETYSLHPLDRDYLYRNLLSDDRRILHSQVSDFFLQMRLPEEYWEDISDLAPMLFEFEHRVKAAEYEKAAVIIDAIDIDYLSLWGFSDQVLDMRKQLEGKLNDGLLDASNLGGIGHAYRRLGEYETAIHYLQRALNVFKRLELGIEKERCLSDLGHAYFNLGETEKAFSYYEQSLSLARHEKDKTAEGRALGNLGHASNKIGKHEEAADLLLEALKIAEETGDGIGEGKRADGLGLVFRNLGMYEQALSYLKRALDVKRIVNDRRGEGVSLNNLSLVYRSMGQYDDAEECARSALVIAQEVGDRRGEGARLSNLASVQVRQNKVSEAIDNFKKGLKIAKEIGDRHGEGIRLNNLGNAYMRLQQYTEALDCFRQALKIAQEVGNEHMASSRSHNVNKAQSKLDDQKNRPAQ